MVIRRRLVAIALLIVACAESTPVTTGTAPTTTPQEPTTTATTSSAVGGLPVVEPLPTLADGRPATFVGVTADYEAVEVDTATGRVLRSFGQAATAAEVASAECAACVNAIDGVWRTVDGAFVYVSECCEPAGGQIHVLTAGQTIDDPHPVLAGWSVAPSPGTQAVLVVGYTITLYGPGDLPIRQVSSDDGSMGQSSAGWHPGASAVAWIDQRAGWSLIAVDPAATEPVETEVALPWAMEGEWLTDVTVDAEGRYLTLLADEAVVFTGDGTVVERFPVEPGSRLGGFDRTGRFLLSVDGESAVRWRGPDGSGVLAEGFLAASW